MQSPLLTQTQSGGGTEDVPMKSHLGPVRPQLTADARQTAGKASKSSPQLSPAHPAGPRDTLLFRPLSLGLVCHLAKADPSCSD